MARRTCVPVVPHEVADDIERARPEVNCHYLEQGQARRRRWVVEQRQQQVDLKDRADVVHDRAAVPLQDFCGMPPFTG